MSVKSRQRQSARLAELGQEKPISMYADKPRTIRVLHAKEGTTVKYWESPTHRSEFKRKLRDARKKALRNKGSENGQEQVSV